MGKEGGLMKWWGQYALYRPAARQEDRVFRYQALSFRPYGPFHPIQGKVAAIGITRGGTVGSALYVDVLGE